MFVYIYFVALQISNSLDVHLRSVHPATLEIVGSNPPNQRAILNLSAPEILQRPAPQQGALPFGAPRPERPSAPANPVHVCAPPSGSQGQAVYDSCVPLAAVARTGGGI